MYTFNDVSEFRQLGFQDPASPVAEAIIFFHNDLCFFFLLVLIFVLWIIVRILFHFVGSTVYSAEFSHGSVIEIVWTLVPTFILVLISLPSFALLYSIDELIDPNLTVKVLGNQWFWSYEFSDFQKDSVVGNVSFDSYMCAESDLNKGSFRLLEVDNRLVLPMYAHIRVLVSAIDVLHSFAVPSLGIKVDAVPGRLNQVSLFVKREGVFFGQCSEICGVNHGIIPIVVEVVDLKRFVLWLYKGMCV